MKINLKPDFLITKPEKLDLDCAIVLNGEDFNPPHVGLLLGNKYYSCTVNRLKLGFSFTQFFQILSRKKQKVIIFNTSLNLDKKDPLKVSYTENFIGEPTGKQNPQLLKLFPSHGHDMSIHNGISRIGFMKGGKSAMYIDENMSDTILVKTTKFIESNK